MIKNKVGALDQSRGDSWRVRYLRAFGRDEDGSIIILTILLLITMLVVGGMAVDFMRYESRRATLQSVSDRAVLAAASLNQTVDGVALVEDYFLKAGFQDSIVGTPTLIDNGNSKTVSVRSQIDMNTFYLRLVGMDTLTAPARSSATEGVGKVEISLVLDISGSMRWDGSRGTAGGGRILDMREAAIAFANQVLHPDNGGQVSLNIIPYAGTTNPGPEMFAYLEGRPYSSFTFDEDGNLYDEDGNLIEDEDTIAVHKRESHCLEIEGTDWSHSGLPAFGRDQVSKFMVWWDENGVVDWGWCPKDQTSIAYALSTPAEAAAYISGMRMHDGTGTHVGMKWGLALLDPTTQPAFAYLNSVSPSIVPNDFVNRPAAWTDNETKKIIVLMTDGAITDQYRPRNPMDPWNLTGFIGTNVNTTTSRAIRKSTLAENVASFASVCNLAKHPSRNIQVYTVAFEVSGAGAQQMRDCASNPSMYYPASGAGLTEVFSGIAQRITDLRLNL